MRRFTGLGIVALLVALAVACEDKKTDPALTDAAATPTTAAGSAAPQGTTVGGADDLSEEDFEEEAEKSITAANLESAIAKMEAELK